MDKILWGIFVMTSVVYVGLCFIYMRLGDIRDLLKERKDD
jgi:hypothetical protein